MKKIVAFIMIQCGVFIGLLFIEGMSTLGSVFTMEYNIIGVIFQVLMCILTFCVGCKLYWQLEDEAAKKASGK